MKDMASDMALLDMEDTLLSTTEDGNKIETYPLTRQQKCELALDISPKKGGKAKTVKETIEGDHRYLTRKILEAGK